MEEREGTSDVEPGVCEAAESSGVAGQKIEHSLMRRTQKLPDGLQERETENIQRMILQTLKARQGERLRQRPDHQIPKNGE